MEEINLFGDTKKDIKPFKKVRYQFNEDSIPDELKSQEGFIETWKEFVAFRHEDLRKPMTERAANRMFKKLLELKDHDPVKLLERSIRNMWQDVYPNRETLKKGKDNYFVQQKNKGGLVL